MSKRTVEIMASFAGVIPNGSFENIKPLYQVREVIEDCAMTDDEIATRQKELQDLNYKQFKAQAEVAYGERLAQNYSNIRFYDGANGLKYPSVTSFLDWDQSFSIPADELAQYASRGTIIHKLVEVYLQTGEWIEDIANKLPELNADLIIVKQGNLGLQLDDVDFKGFYEAYPFEVISLENVCLNHEWKYGGRLDIKCLIKKGAGKWDKVDGVKYGVPTILDIKTGAINKIKHLKQQTAYAHAEGNEDVQQIGLIPLNNGTKQGFSAPVIEPNVDKYWAMVTRDREMFRQRYGI